VPVEAIVGICRGAFLHGRFHRDFNIDSAKADRRYETWLRELHGSGNVSACCTGRISRASSRIPARPGFARARFHYRGRGLAKYFWSRVCVQLFAEGLPEIRSSISAANLAVVNLYATLGFRFRNPVDIYHRMCHELSVRDVHRAAYGIRSDRHQMAGPGGGRISRHPRRKSGSRALLLNPWIISGLAAALLASVTWMAAMTRLPLSHAYPFTTLAFVLVML